MAPNLSTTPAATVSTNNTNNHKTDGRSSQNDVKKELSSENGSSNNDNNTDDASSWNVVGPKRQQVTSSSSKSKPQSKPQSKLKSKQQYQKQKVDVSHNKSSGGGGSARGSNRSGHQKHQSSQQHSKPNNNKSHQSNTNNRSAQQAKNTNSSKNENVKKKVMKPKAITTVGDMIPTSKKKQIKKDSQKKVSQQHLQQKKAKQEDHPTKQPPQQNKNAPRRQQGQLPPSNNKPNIHIDSAQHFPALGGVSGPSSQPPPVPDVPSKKGWIVLPKPSTNVIRTEVAKASNNSNNTSFAPNKSSRQIRPAPSPVSSNSKQSSMNANSPPFVMGSSATTAQPTWVLKRGETMPPGSSTGAAKDVTAPAKKKKTKARNTPKQSVVAPAIQSAAALFFKPKPRDLPKAQVGKSRELEGEENQLLRLMQERNVYQKRGRQRVAPRKKKFSALKKKVLQERLDQWRALHPEEVPASERDTREASTAPSFSRSTRSLCLYNYAEPDELEDDDEYEEIRENLTAMAIKIGPFEDVFIPRESVQKQTLDTENSNDNGGDDSDSSHPHPVFVLFEKESDASAALACWRGLVIGGRQLEVVGLEVQDKNATDGQTPWAERALAAESKRRDQLGKTPASEESRAVEILLQKVLTEEDFDDEDCISESLEDLKKIASRFGVVGTIRADGTNGDVLVTYDNATLEETRKIAEDLCRVVVGGQHLYATVRELLTAGGGSGASASMTSSSTLLLENVLTDDDLQDSDCLQESLNDIKELCSQYGSVLDVVAKGFAVKVTYQDDGINQTVAQGAAGQLNGIVLGGNTVRASVLAASDGDGNPLEHSIDLYNLLTEDDLEDEDCMDESLGDVEKLASKYGEVASANLCKLENDAKDPTKVYVRIRFAGDDPSVVASSLEGFHGMVIGGQIVSAVPSGSGRMQPQAFETTNPGDNKRKPTETPQNNAIAKDSNIKKARTDDKAPLYSGDKLISERFAVMKRVPKIPNKEGPRAYASGAPTDERIRPLLTEMLRELMRLQKRAVEDKNAKARRRMVMGLREVARGIRAHKVKMVVMANNLDQYGVIDEKLQEIIDLAKSEDVPLFFEFTKRSLGKAIGKSIKVAVVGIQNADGAHQPFKKLNSIASRM